MDSQNLIGVLSHSSYFGLFLILIFVTLLDYMYLTILKKYFKKFSAEVSSRNKRTNEENVKTLLEQSWLSIASEHISVAVLEEFIFRVIPIVGVLICIDIFALPVDMALVLIVVFSSIIFGVLHGGWRHIFIQGVSGLIYSLIFIMLIDTSGPVPDISVSFIVCTILHFTWNIFMIFQIKIKSRDKGTVPNLEFP